MTTQAIERKLKEMNVDYTKNDKGDIATVINGYDVEHRQRMSHVIAVKPVTDESDPQSDYCAWSFLRRIKDLDTL